MKIYDQQRMESLQEKKAAHMQTWCQGFANFIAKGDRLANSNLRSGVIIFFLLASLAREGKK